MIDKLAKENPQLNFKRLEQIYRANILNAMVHIAQDLNKEFGHLKPYVYPFPDGNLVDITPAVTAMMDALLEENLILSVEAYNILRVNDNLTQIRPNRYKEH